MSNDVVIRVENLSKQYRLGTISHATLSKDLQSWWARIRGKEDPNLRFDQIPSASSRANGINNEPSTKHNEPSTTNQAPSTKNQEFVSDPDRFWALKDISFEVKQGEVLGIIGKNGAGKSTLLKILSRVTTPTTGQIKVKGRVASLLEVGTGFHPELTGRENIFLNGAILGMDKAEIKSKQDEIIAFAEIEKFIDTPVKRYSSGMYVRLAFAVAAHLEPEILVVDEVLAVGDVSFQKKCLGKMDEVAKGGRTVLFVSHNMEAISRLTQHCLVLGNGLIGFNGPTDEAISQYLMGKRKLVQKGRVPVEKLECDYQWIDSPVLRIAELGLADGQSNDISIGDDLRLEIFIESQRSFEGLYLGYSVNSETGGSILSGYSSAFDIPGKGAFLYELILNKLTLAPGYYNLSISITTGGLYGTKHLYNGILGFGYFCVKPFYHNSRVADWDSRWGRVVHLDSTLAWIPMPPCSPNVPSA